MEHPLGRKGREGKALQTKARQNLQVALFLLERGDIDAAANRLYYALFQAAVHALRRQGRTPGDFRPAAEDWDHTMVSRWIKLVRGRPEDGVLFRRLREQRERADYSDDRAERGELELLKHEAERFVDEVTS